MEFEQGFNAEEYKDIEEFSLLPKMKALARIVKSEEKPNSKSNGTILTFDYEIMAPEKYKGRHVRSRHNFKHPNPEAQAIAQREVAAICKAVNVLRPRNTQELHNLPLVIKIDVERQTEKHPVTGQQVPRIDPGTGAIKLANNVGLWQPAATPLGEPEPLPAPTFPAAGGQAPPVVPGAPPAAAAVVPGAAPGGSPPPWVRAA